METVYDKKGRMSKYSNYDKDNHETFAVFFNEDSSILFIAINENLLNTQEKNLLNTIKEMFNELKDKYTDPKQIANKIEEKIFNQFGNALAKGLL